jgi:type I restriction enzyme S subunit
MRNSWQRVNLGDLFRLKHGYPFKSEFYRDDGDLILLTPGNFQKTGGLRLDQEKVKFYQGPVPEGFILSGGDVLIVMTDLKQDAPILGSTATIPESGRFLHNQRLGKVTDLSEIVEPMFLPYLLNSELVRGRIRASASGSTVRHTSPGRIYDVQVSLPPLELQLKIASILVAYNELAENNLRRIATLEEMARAIYREWYVNLNAPTDVDLRDVALGEAFRVSLGGTPPRNRPELWRGEIPWINSGAINSIRVTEGVEYITEEAIQTSATKLWPRGTTLIAITGATLGQVSFLEVDACANQSVVGVLDEAGIAVEYLYLTISDRINELIARAGGSAQQHINKGIVEEFEIALPSRDNLELFAATVRPIFYLIANLIRAIANLRRTRDLLLPRLMSGDIDVSGLDVDTSWLAA